MIWFFVKEYDNLNRKIKWYDKNSTQYFEYKYDVDNDSLTIYQIREFENSQILTTIQVLDDRIKHEKQYNYLYNKTGATTRSIEYYKDDYVFKIEFYGLLFPSCDTSKQNIQNIAITKSPDKIVIKNKIYIH